MTSPASGFDSHAFLPGEYVSIKEQDGALRTFQAMAEVRTLFGDMTN
jgi:hypothetical protein